MKRDARTTLEVNLFRVLVPLRVLNIIYILMLTLYCFGAPVSVK